MGLFLLHLRFNLAKHATHLAEVSHLRFSLHLIDLHHWFGSLLLNLLLFFTLLFLFLLDILGILLFQILLIDELFFFLKTLSLASAQILTTFHQFLSSLHLSISHQCRFLISLGVWLHKFHSASCLLTWLYEFWFNSWTIVSHHTFSPVVIIEQSWIDWSICFQSEQLP